jgi:hypothetical protein
MNIKEIIDDWKDVIILTYNYYTKPYETTYFTGVKPSLKTEIDNMRRRKRAMLMLSPFSLPASQINMMQQIRTAAQQNFNKQKSE